MPEITQEAAREQAELLRQAQEAGLTDGSGPEDVAEIIVITGPNSAEGGE